MEKQKKKLKIIIGKKRGAQTKFAREHNFSVGYINNVLKGKRPPGSRLLRVMQTYR